MGFLAASVFATVFLSAQSAERSTETGSVGRTEQVQYVKWRRLRLPCRYKTDGAAAVVGLRLFWTKDDGNKWHVFPKEGLLEPEKTLVFEAPEDGAYGFRVQAVDAAGHFSPAPGPGDEPTLRVVVDTTKPEIEIRAPVGSLSFYSGQVVTLRWVVRDSNLPPDPVNIFYVRDGEAEAIPIEADRKGYPSEGELSWALPLQEGSISFVFATEDLAGNRAEKRCGPFPIKPYLARLGPKAVVAEGFSRHLFLPIFYRFPDIKPEDVGTVEVYWFPLDRPESNEARWHLAGVDEDRSSPFVFKAPEDGRYALRVAVKGKDGKSYLRPLLSPQEADVVTVIDTHDPQVEIVSVNGVKGEEVWLEGGGALEITLLVRDRNLPPRSVALQYSLDDGASWQTLADGLTVQPNKPFTYKWTLPRITCPSFLLRARAVDAVGRTGIGTYPGPIHIRDKQADAVVDAAALRRRGELALSLGTDKGLKAALNLLKTAVGFAPNDPEAREALARALLAAGKRTEALIHLRKAVELRPSEVSYRLELVEQLIEEGRKTGLGKLFEEARRHLDQVRIEDLYVRSDFALLREKYRLAQEALAAWEEKQAERLERER